jgi:S1-C subfamily serine protease
MGILMSLIEDRSQYEELKANGVNHYLEIKKVTVDSPAEHFGLLAGDIIISIDDKDIDMVPDVIELLWDKNPGDMISFKVYRNNEYHTITVVLGTKKEEEVQTPVSIPK